MCSLWRKPSVLTATVMAAVLDDLVVFWPGPFPLLVLGAVASSGIDNGVIRIARKNKFMAKDSDTNGARATNAHRCGIA